MAELTPLDVKLGEVLGLVQAAQDATRAAAGLTAHDEISDRLERMRAEAEETERRCLELVDGLGGKRTRIRAKSRQTRSGAAAMMRLCLGDGSGELEALGYLTMAEAGELGQWEIVREMSERMGDRAALELAEWAIEVQERHKIFVRESSLLLAAEEAAIA